MTSIRVISARIALATALAAATALAGAAAATHQAAGASHGTVTMAVTWPGEIIDCC